VVRPRGTLYHERRRTGAIHPQPEGITHRQVNARLIALDEKDGLFRSTGKGERKGEGARRTDVASGIPCGKRARTVPAKQSTNSLRKEEKGKFGDLRLLKEKYLRGGKKGTV